MTTDLAFKPAVQAALDYINHIPTDPAQTDPIAGARDFYHRFIPMAGTPAIVKNVQNLTLPTTEGPVNVRIYRPSDTPGLPVTVYFHGGWFYLGSLDTHDTPLRALTNAADCVVISVDYALAPEHPFPKGLKEGIAVLHWIAAHADELQVDANRIGVAGDSAGAALATVIARHAKENNGPALRFQALIYPVTDASLQTPSWKEFAEGLNLDLAGAELAWSLYIPHSQDRQHPDAAPLLAEDLTGLPPALVITAEYDPLRDEGMAYAAALRRNGVPVQETLYEGMIHGFFQMGGMIEEGNTAINETAAFIRKHF
ncbi:acetyl esterase [Chitinophaga ginsengisegetis]|uniref:Acetyl esterase n=1 Tax=Chitinophaga ginsengisegetis TaxID=393003 RepID=A0A1T5PA68_9BACT|nr:alpha/beta hydrolase [Chitinophaga ginsengisegetis]SKD09503.1 acetyl esterase [Chitinophaga ginsengisegetis]